MPTTYVLCVCMCMCVSAPGVALCAQVHWLGPNLELTPRLEVHGSTLVQVRPPGFVVRGFLWCNSKHQPQLAADSKEVHRLNGSWPDQDTQDIVSVDQQQAAAAVAWCAVAMGFAQQTIQQHDVCVCVDRPCAPSWAITSLCWSLMSLASLIALGLGSTAPIMFLCWCIHRLLVASQCV